MWQGNIGRSSTKESLLNSNFLSQSQKSETRVDQLNKYVSSMRPRAQNVWVFLVMNDLLDFLSAKLGLWPSFSRKQKSDALLLVSLLVILVELNEVDVSWLSQLIMWVLCECKQVYLYTDERLNCIKVQTVQMWQPNKNSRILCYTVFLYSTVQTVHHTQTL